MLRRAASSRYLHYLNKISYEPAIPAAGSSGGGGSGSDRSGSRGGARSKQQQPPPPDHFAGERHRLVYEAPDNFDTPSANWIHALRSDPQAPVENVRNNNGNDPPRHQQQLQQSDGTRKGHGQGQQRSPPYTSRRSTVRTANSYPGRSSSHHPSSSSRPVPAEEASREKASHRRWVPTESRSVNGWIAGLRDDSSGGGGGGAGRRRSQQQASARRQQQQDYARQQLWRLEGDDDDGGDNQGGGRRPRHQHQRQSFLRNVHRNSHLLRHSTHSSRLGDLEAGIMEAAAAARKGYGGDDSGDGTGEEYDGSARVLVRAREALGTLQSRRPKRMGGGEEDEEDKEKEE